VPGEQIKVKKIVLVYELEEFFGLEREMKLEIASIQELLLKNRLNFDDPEVEKHYKEIDALEEKIDQLIFQLLASKANPKFVGQALVSFETEVFRMDKLREF
jgi:hypothetical protein